MHGLGRVFQGQPGASGLQNQLEGPFTKKEKPKEDQVWEQITSSTLDILNLQWI